MKEYRRNYRKRRKRKLIITLSVLVVLAGAASTAAIVLNRNSEGSTDLAYAKEREQTTVPEDSTERIFDMGSVESETATLLGEESTDSAQDESGEGAQGQTTAGQREGDNSAADDIGIQPPAGSESGDKPAAESGTEDESAGLNSGESAIVPESEEVEDSYFDDAVFIGDSRVDGFRIQAGLSNPEYLTAKGMNVKAIFTEKYIKKNGTNFTVLEALKKLKFNKVYIKLGINELGWKYPEIFAEDYAKLIGEIREINPDARIYVQSIIVVSKSKSDKDEIYNNKNIATFNKLLLEMAEEEGVSYLDLNEVLADEDGNLPEDASFDGVHLTPDYCKVWLKYLKNHVITEVE